MGHVRAKEAFAYTDHNGIPRVVRPGDLFNDDDPALANRGHLFETVGANVERRQVTVEEATAEPGAKRSVSAPKPAKTTAAKGDGASADQASTTAAPSGDGSGSNQV